MSRKYKRLARAKEKHYGNKLRRERWTEFNNGSLSLSAIFLIMFLLDLVQGKVFLAYGGGMGTFTRTDSPAIYWLFIAMYFIFGVLFFRMYLKNREQSDK